MTIIDTSSWIEFLRGRKNTHALRVEKLLNDGDAAWCEQVQLELWTGAHRDESRALEDLESLTTLLPVNAAVWRKSFRLARECRAAGVTVPSADLLIAACALHHRVGIEHKDGHYDAILPLGTGI